LLWLRLSGQTCTEQLKKDIWIIKTEYWQINKADKHKKYDTTYRLELPGVAINEFLDISIGPEKFKSEDVKKAIALLVKEGILKSCMNFRDEIRYKIADQRLRYMVHRLRDFHYEEFDLLLYKWEDFEEPTENEKERIKWLMGEEHLSPSYTLIISFAAISHYFYHNKHYLTSHYAPSTIP